MDINSGDIYTAVHDTYVCIKCDKGWVVYNMKWEDREAVFHEESEQESFMKKLISRATLVGNIFVPLENIFNEVDSE